MKTIKYYLMALLMSGFMTAGFVNQPGTTNKIIIQPSKSLTIQELSKSQDIISARLKDYVPGKFTVAAVPGKNQIMITLTGVKNLTGAKNLVMHKGVVEFYETCTNSELASLLNDNGKLFSMMNMNSAGPETGKVGCIPAAEAGKVNDYIKALGQESKCKFAWSQALDNPKVCLYALKPIGEKGAIITGNEVESAGYSGGRINIVLKQEAAVLFAEATERNMDKVIAIALDNEILSAPRVKSKIETGKIEISGDYTELQCKYIAALLNNGELPSSFTEIN
jgi:preprotein translocase subunit SecD